MISTARAFFTAAILGAAVLATSGTTATAIDLSDKMVRLMLNLGSGSVADLAMRQLAPSLRRSLPGQPTVIIENRPGGQRTLAAEVLSRMSPDGLTLGVFTGYVAEWATNPSVRVAPRQFAVVGSISAEAVLLMRSNLGVGRADDLRHVKRTIFAGSASAISGHVLRMRLFLDAIGVPGRTITGYKGQVEMTQALMRDELDMTSYNWEQFLMMREEYAREGKIGAPLMFGEVDDAGNVVGSPLVEMETVDAAWRRLAPASVDSPEYKAFKLMYLIQSVSRLFVLAPGTPPDTVAVWEKALRAAYADPEYRKLTSKMGAAEAELSSPAVVMERLARIDPATREAAVEAAIKRVSN